MLELLRDEKAYAEEEKRISELIRRGAKLPNPILNERLRHYAFIEYFIAFDSNFHQRMQRFLKETERPVYTIAVLKPDPVQYFHFHFHKYPVLTIPVETSVDEFAKSCQQDPGDSPGDAVAFYHSKVIMHDSFMDWCIYGDRDYETMVAGFRTRELSATFKRAHRPYVFTAREAEKYLMDPRYVHLPSEERRTFLENYKDK